MKSKFVLFLITGILLLSLPGISGAENNLKRLIAENYKQTNDICTAVKGVIKEGYNPKEITMTAIKMGYSACIVIKCAIDSGASPELVIKGAIEAGATAEVVSRCCIEAGVDEETVAKILEREKLPGLGFTPAGGPAPATITVGMPGRGHGGGHISPSRP